MEKDLRALQLLTRWNIRGIRLFNLCKKGELQPYNWREEKIVTLDSCKGTKEFEEFILKRKQELKRIEKGSEAAGDFYCGSGISPPYRPLTDEELEKEAIEDFRPKDCELFDYTLPRSDSAAKQKLKKILNFFFKESDVKKYEIDHDLYGSDKDIEEFEGQKEILQEHLQKKETVEQNEIPIIAFYKDSDFWKIGEKGKEIPLKHLNGFEYITFLIRYKNKSFKPLEVYYFNDIPEKYKYINKIDFQRIGDTYKLNSYIEYLDEKLTTENDPNKRIEINHQITELRKIKNEGIQAFNQKSDKCRVSVFKAIKIATKKICKELPSLKEYFNCGKSEIIKTGSTFSYQQFNFGLSIDWILDKPTQH